MNIVFPPVDESYIQAKIEGGDYPNAAELVRDAVRRLREEDAKQHARLMAALEVGERDVREGRTELYTPELLAEIEDGARRMVAEGRVPDPDACP